MHRVSAGSVPVLGAVSIALLVTGLAFVPVTLQAATTPNDPLYKHQYGPPQMRVEQAWNHSTGAGVVVAVVDTGVDLDHPDLAANVIPGRAFINCGDQGCGNGDWQSPASDPKGHPHGTHVAGTVAAVTSNGVGVAGVAPDAQVLAVRVLNDAGYGTSRDVGSGIRWAADHGAHVINMSLGDAPGSQVLGITDPDEQYLRESVAYATRKGVVVITSAGNDSYSVCGTPAWYEGALCITSTRRDETSSEFSNSAIKPNLQAVAAPGGTIVPIECGDSIISTVPPGTADPTRTTDCGYPADRAYDEFQGTSMSAPHASGVAALLAAMGCSRDQTVTLMTTTARKPGTDVRGVWDPRYGYGIVDAAEATSRATRLCHANPAANLRPVAADDVAVASFGRHTPIDVLSNDRDPEGAPLTLVSGGATGGRVELRNGKLFYTPRADAGATDVVRYAVTDPSGAISVATVQVSMANSPSLVDAEEATVLHFQGNRDDGCSGDGRIDTVATTNGCPGPSLSTTAGIDAGPAAHWIPGHQVDGTNHENVYDPHWTWTVPAPVTVRGPVTINWWAACVSCRAATPTTWIAKLFVDGVLQASTTLPVSHSGTPSRASAVLQLPGDMRVGETLTVQVDPIRPVSNPPPTTHQADVFMVFYDSQRPCPGAAAEACDSTVSLTSITKNAAPIAVDDTITMLRGRRGSLNVLANDAEADFEPMTLESFTQPARGVVVRSGNVLTYTPPRGFAGRETFTYTVVDRRGIASVATVTLVVGRR